MAPEPLTGDEVIFCPAAIKLPFSSGAEVVKETGTVGTSGPLVCPPSGGFVFVSANTPPNF